MAPAAVVSSLSDDMLVKKFANRNTRKIFEELFRRHKSQIYNTCLYYMKKPEDAEDMVGQTFYKAWRGRRGFRGDSKFSTWLTRIAIRECLMDIRHVKSGGKGEAKTVSLDAGVPNEDGDSFTLLDIAQDPRTLDRMIDNERIARAWLRLTPMQKKVFHLYFVKQHTIEEIQGILGTSEASVKSRIFHGRQKFFAGLKAADAPAMTSVT